MNTSIIYLVGFMGAGKTSIGSMLADLMRRPFIDLDVEIQRTEGRTIREIFQHAGESGFRQVERRELVRVASLAGIVVALGGGAFCSEENQRLVRSSGVSVWLDAPLDILLSRCVKDGSRPLLAARGEMEALLERRRAYYAEADFRIDTSNQAVEAIARIILHSLRTAP